MLYNFTLNTKTTQDVISSKAHHNLSQEKDRHYDLTKGDATPVVKPLLCGNSRSQLLKSWETCNSCMRKNYVPTCKNPWKWYLYRLLRAKAVSLKPVPTPLKGCKRLTKRLESYSSNNSLQVMKKYLLIMSFLSCYERFIRILLWENRPF